MARVVVVTVPELAPGYALAGVSTRPAAAPADAARVLAELLADAEVGVIAVHAPHLAGLDEGLRRRLEASVRPVVVPLPSGEPGGDDLQASLSDALRRAIGYRIHFGPGEEEP